ncbi:hypothetical protein G6F45_014231 [Rhizopus arrhizus]|nr:hypothetical protein G6F45_014231 [Rhizopus arrhizus]
MPSPSGPWCRISCRNAGSIATTPPSSTENMSSAIAPTMIRLPTTKRAPSAMLLKLGAAGPVCTGSSPFNVARRPIAPSATTVGSA